MTNLYDKAAVKPLGKAAIDEIRRRFINSSINKVSLKTLSVAYRQYLIFKRVVDHTPPPSELRERLTQFHDALSAFKRDLNEFRHSNVADVVNRPFQIGNRPDPFTALATAIDEPITACLEHLTEFTSQIRPGKWRNPRRYLAERVVEVVEFSGQMPDARQKGMTVQTLEILLEDAGDQSADARKMVAAVLVKREARAAKKRGSAVKGGQASAEAKKRDARPRPRKAIKRPSRASAVRS